MKDGLKIIYEVIRDNLQYFVGIGILVYGALHAPRIWNPTQIELLGLVLMINFLWQTKK